MTMAEPRDFDIGVSRRLALLERELAYLKSIVTRGNQAVDTTSDVLFDSLKIGTPSGNPGAGDVYASGLIFSDQDGAGGGFWSGASADVQFYRSAANTWRTPDALTVDGEILTGLVGTWTPAWTGTGTAGVFTYTNQAGDYVKIGGMVFFSGRMTISAIGTPPTTNMTITGLPFTSHATKQRGTVVFGRISQLDLNAADVQLIAFVNANATTIAVETVRDNGASVAYPAASFVNTATDVIFNGWYFY